MQAVQMGTIYNLNDYRPTQSQLINKKALKTKASKSTPKYSIESSREPVCAFKTKEDIQRAKDYFLNRPERYAGQNIRDWCIFVVGINIMRRAGDLLHLRVHNVLNTKYEFKSHIDIYEQKNQKPAHVLITPVVRDALEKYLNSLDEINLSDPLFPSRNKDKITGKKKAMGAKNLYKKIKALSDELELAYNIATHSLRKTPGYHGLRDNPNNPHVIATISQAYNHNDQKTTFHYLGIDQEELDEFYLNNQI